MMALMKELQEEESQRPRNKIVDERLKVGIVQEPLAKLYGPHLFDKPLFFEHDSPSDPRQLIC